LILALAPAMLVIALIIRLKSPGPILVRQERFGRDLRPFSMLKFRSMVDGAEGMLGELSHLNEAGGPLFKIRKDPRLTPVGAILRRFSLDELPQLVNVLRGEMSLVGPRPPLPPEVEADYLRQRTRLRFPPGMTGLWQVSGRSELRYEAMIGLDYTYMRGWSPLQDIRILLRTVPAVITGKGAC
jgi:lipopolysaccharide/colanic/teichoic acid biosynthesis glycosyltransferase